MLSPGRWSLRTRLLALLLLLLTAVSTAIVGVTALELRSYLIHQVDVRLVAVDQRWVKPLPTDPNARVGGAFGPSATGTPGSGESTPGDGTGLGSTTGPDGGQAGVPPWQGTPAEFVGLRGQSTGTVAAHIVGSKAENAVLLAPGGVTEQLPASEAAKLAAVPVDHRPRTVTLGSYGEYRVTARLVPDGTAVVSGLSLSEVSATVDQLIIVAGCVAGGGVLLLGVVGAVTVRRTLRPLRRVAATAARVAELPLDRGEVTLRVRVPEVDTDPRTEVGQVGAALNHMLGHVGAALAARHASETRVRQFVADASHELRTPLAAISGYAQLTRRIGAQNGFDDPRQSHVPPDVVYALSRVESETKRMTALVEDLLLLARLDSGRPLEHGCVDLSLLVVDVVSDAHIAAPGHRFSLSLPADPVTVRGDQARLHQVLANLLANARTHTPAGTSVVVALELAPGTADSSTGEARLSVIDDGPGIPAELLPNVFERFARGDTSRSRAAGSTGLGLAIVAAVVEAHGGRISVSSAPGRTAFTVTLPRTVPAASPAVAGVAGDLCTADARHPRSVQHPSDDGYAPDEFDASDGLDAPDELYLPDDADAVDDRDPVVDLATAGTGAPAEIRAR
ncbi:HAMP domain-containing sensor histidine kinase [Pseudofrankia sp. DC12]|uniref:sensor histidine kinase n=1 Tax=Pseudofrankia sp. DC12 TaxID=683315 RepID=UPI0005F7F8C9|nr:HAMP domain-containing sensor histidine kinase [Pseudofrankia sp. DC12]